MGTEFFPLFFKKKFYKNFFWFLACWGFGGCWGAKLMFNGYRILVGKGQKWLELNGGEYT